MRTAPALTEVRCVENGAGTSPPAVACQVVRTTWCQRPCLLRTHPTRMPNVSRITCARCGVRIQPQRVCASG